MWNRFGRRSLREKSVSEHLLGSGQLWIQLEGALQWCNRRPVLFAFHVSRAEIHKTGGQVGRQLRHLSEFLDSIAPPVLVPCFQAGLRMSSDFGRDGLPQ